MDNSYRFFSNRDCKYFPCHDVKNKDDFNCLFCYCPLYLMEECGGNYKINKGVKDCSGCMIPHSPKGYDYINKKLMDEVFANAKAKKDFIFISDFDGTITAKDFYWILLDDYIGREGIDFYYDWKKTKKIGTEFLNMVFQWHKFSDHERMEALAKVSLDKDLEKVIDKVEEKGGEFMILSAGFRYYIDDALDKRNLNRIQVVTNDGTFRDGCFVMEPDEKGEFYSPVYGVDKEAVAKYYKKKCKKLIFAA